MPRPPTAKKQSLTFKQLGNYDDILTDALVDHVYYWTKIPKNRAAYHPSRGIREEEIVNIIQNEAIINQDADAAESNLLATGGLGKFHASLKTPAEQADFRRHLRRYIQIYLPDCPWEVNSTNRYTIVSHEASVTARRYIRRNETIRYLAGISVVITPQEERELADKKRNFSIVVSSRNRTMSLFMGPARFANHDCRANAKLMTTVHSGIEVVATQDIAVGEEITVTYGDHYFGEYNCDCLCQTCEKARVNGWAPGGGAESGVLAGKTGNGEDESSPGYALRRRRRRREDSAADSSRTPSVAPDMRPRIPKTRLKSMNAASTSSSDSLDAAISPYPEVLMPGAKRSADAMTPPITPAKRARTRLNETYVADPSESATSSNMSERATSISSQETGDGVLTDATSPPESGIDKPSPEPQIRLPASTRRGDVSAIFKQEEMNDARAHCLANAIPFVPRISHVAVVSAGNVEDAATPMPLQQMSHAMAVRQTQPQVMISVEACDAPAAHVATTTRRKYQRRVYNKATTPPVSSARVPGDYTLTPLLLSQPEMAWIYCTICNTAFVQTDAYFTRSACPRCERHSKLYGYVWPKTEKAGPNDEGRVLDHRTVHRFLDAEDEARIRGRKIPICAKHMSGGHDGDDHETGQDSCVGGPGIRRGRGRPRLIPEARKAMQAKAEEDDGAVTFRRSGRPRRLSTRAALKLSL